jgi:adenine C2-methylase RlmN of 23S rRNA A2503 and tRNA A37
MRRSIPLLVRFYIIHVLCKNFAAHALATLTAGQQLVPRYNSLLPWETPPQKWSVWDLPRVEQWATERNLTSTNIKAIYRMAMNCEPPKPILDHLQARSSLVDEELMLRQLLHWSFPKQHAHAFVQQFSWSTIQLIDTQHSSSSNGNSIKLVFQLPWQDGNSSRRLIETVIIRHDSVPHGTSDMASPPRRYTVCVSSQVGCTRACTFCATGTQMKFQSQLSSADIVEQVCHAQQVLSQQMEQSEKGAENGKLRNIVFMGMGEPLDNWSNVYEACRTLTHQCILGFSPKHITVSTVGVSPDIIRQMAREAPALRLAVSLHGATQAIREQLMPATKSATLSELESALNDHIHISGQRGGPMIEYLLIDGVNDSDEAAQALIDFCSRQQRQHRKIAETSTKSAATLVSPLIYVNLIPYNPTFVGQSYHRYQTPSDVKIRQFHEKLLESGIIKSHVRWSSAASRDTSGACGQLALLASQAPG